MKRAQYSARRASLQGVAMPHSELAAVHRRRNARRAGSSLFVGPPPPSISRFGTPDCDVVRQYYDGDFREMRLMTISLFDTLPSQASTIEPFLIFKSLSALRIPSQAWADP
jgi:hypothetical protein